MKRALIVCLTAMILLTACGGAATDQQDTGPDTDEVVTIYKPPT